MPTIKRQKKPRHWKGKLAQKIRPRVLRPLNLCAITDARTLARANKKMTVLYRRAVETERNKNLRLLLQHYKISDNDYRSLAIQLALELGIKGFGIEHNLFEVEAEAAGLVDPGKRIPATDAWTPERLCEL